MALPILDGNQTSTTLATTVSGGAHYPNHIIANGTVTANVDYASQELSTPSKATQIGYKNTAPDFVFVEEGTNNFPVKIFTTDGAVGNGNASLPISGTVTANVLFSATVGESMPPQAVALGFYNGNNAGIAAVDDSYNKLPIAGTVTANLDNNNFISALVSYVESTSNYNLFPVEVDYITSVTVGSLPVQLSTTTIGGTARLNVTLSSATTVGATAPSYANLYGGSDGTNLRAISVDSSGRTVVTGATSILGTPSVTIGAISGTVTANNPSGALTTRFGSVTTANTAQLTAAVTNSARRYLLAQNISAGTVTIGIGFSPTTTQGIQLSAGGGLSFDSFCPTGAVWWLSSTTGSNFTILEG